MTIIDKLKKRMWIIKAVIQSSLTEKQDLIRGYFKRKSYYPPEKVNADIKNIINCMLCPNMCRFDCPAVQASKNESHSPATKARIAYYLEMNRLRRNEENIKPIFEGCLHCAGCKEWCPFDIAVGDLLEGVASDLFLDGKIYSDLKSFSNRISLKNGLYEQEKYVKSTKILESMLKGDIYYFPGCVTMGNHYKVISSICKLASSTNEKLVAKPRERVCCGAPTIYYGDLNKAKEFAQKNYNHIKQLNVKAILCECPECAYTLKEEYPKLGFDFELPIYHVTEWIANLLKEKKINLENGDVASIYKESLPISYHDPCVLSRKMRIIKEPYYVLQKIFPKNFKEITYSRELTHCCGFGGVVNIVNPELANKISINRLNEFSAKKIKTIVTSCPTCWYSFMRNNKEMQFEIIDFVELIVSLLKEK
ncbi:MAG: (Fe-S)-binding protein [Asgard group archaeon]|nr:(Fe-S)-binding protein [Asgard group archaeon]